MDSRISWKKAYGGSLVIHALVFGLFMCFLAGSVAHHEEEKMYVIDLDASELTGAGSGHAGGGGGGAANLFPDKLSDAAVAERRAQVEQVSSALVSPSSVSPVESASANPSPTNAVSSDGGSSAGGGEGSGSGTGSGSGEGSGSGSGYGEGIGSGSGDGVGDGEGYGEGSGSGQGSGDSGSDGTGTGVFDTDGFWSAVNANKTYPPMAVKRGLTGTVYVTVTLDGSGNCIGVSASGDGLLAKAAMKAVYAACPYPNPTGGDITVNVPVTFELQ